MRRKTKEESVTDRINLILALRPWCQRFQSAEVRQSMAARKYGKLKMISQRVQKATGYAPSLETINKWLKGSAIPSPKNLERLAITLEVDESWLLFG